ncbi:MAG TPA: hypothetical protein VK563_13775 [Puia sp.]|nr:hypothetical protein [Puia sp.]
MKKIIFGVALLLFSGSSALWANDNYRSQTGQSLFVVHNILSDQLPAMLRAHIREDYKGYWITELYVDVHHKESTYYITVENADETIRMSAADAENWVITSTVPK